MAEDNEAKAAFATVADAAMTQQERAQAKVNQARAFFETFNRFPDIIGNVHIGRHGDTAQPISRSARLPGVLAYHEKDERPKDRPETTEIVVRLTGTNKSTFDSYGPGDVYAVARRDKKMLPRFKTDEYYVEFRRVVTMDDVKRLPAHERAQVYARDPHGSVLANDELRTVPITAQEFVNELDKLATGAPGNEDAGHIRDLVDDLDLF